MRTCGHSHVGCGASSGIRSVGMVSPHGSRRLFYSSDCGLGVGARSSNVQLWDSGCFSNLLGLGLRLGLYENQFRRVVFVDRVRRSWMVPLDT